MMVIDIHDFLPEVDTKAYCVIFSSHQAGTGKSISFMAFRNGMYSNHAIHIIRIH